MARFAPHGGGLALAVFAVATLFVASPALAEFVFFNGSTTTTLLTTNETSVTEGDEVTFTATVAPAAAGTVEFKKGDTSLGTKEVEVETGVATLPTAALPAGTYSVTATFSPTDTDAFSPSTSDPVTVTVTARVPEQEPEQTSTTLTGSTGLNVGGEAHFTATVTPHAAGLVEFKNGDTTLGTANVNADTGVATFSTAALPLGINSVTAVFTPDDDTAFTPSNSDALSVTVMWFVTTVLTVDPASVTEGDEVTFTATVATVSTEGPAVEGTVEFFCYSVSDYVDVSDDVSLGTATLHNGVATLSTDALPVGTNWVYARFTPFDNTFFYNRSPRLPVTVDEATTDTDTEGDEESSETDTLPQTGDSSAPVAALTLVAATTLTAGVSYALVGRTKAHRKF